MLWNNHIFIFRKYIRKIETELGMFFFCIPLELCTWVSIFNSILGLLYVKMLFSGTGIDQNGKSHNCDNWSLSKIQKWLVSFQ